MVIKIGETVLNPGKIRRGSLYFSQDEKGTVHEVILKALEGDILALQVGLPKGVIVKYEKEEINDACLCFRRDLNLLQVILGKEENFKLFTWEEGSPRRRI